MTADRQCQAFAEVWARLQTARLARRRHQSATRSEILDAERGPEGHVGGTQGRIGHTGSGDGLSNPLRRHYKVLALAPRRIEREQPQQPPLRVEQSTTRGAHGKRRVGLDDPATLDLTQRRHHALAHGEHLTTGEADCVDRVADLGQGRHVGG